MAIVDLIVSQTDPITAILLVGIIYYVRSTRNEIRREIRENRDRVERLEATHIPE